MIEQKAQLEGATILVFGAGLNETDREAGPLTRVGEGASTISGRRKQTTLDRVCDTTIFVIIALPFVFAIGALLRRLF